MASELFGRQRECRFYTAGCGNKMAVSATGPRAANELGGPVIPGREIDARWKISTTIIHKGLHIMSVNFNRTSQI